MANGTHLTDDQSWAAALGFPHLLRTVRLAIWPPGKLVIALAAVILTVLWAGVLDWVAGNNVAEDAIVRYLHATRAGTTVEAASGDQGVFEVFVRHERNCAGTACRLSFGLIPDVSAPSAVALGGAGTVLGNIANMAGGVCWLIGEHIWYAILLGLGGLAIWSLAGGAICRMTALQFARNETIDAAQALSFARRKWGSLASAPLLPLAGAAFVALGLYVLGLGFRIPWIGDLLGGVLMLPALMGGLVAALALAGLVPAASLSWPAVVVDDADAFDAIAGRGYAYFFQRPAKMAWYVAVSCVVGGVCWMVIRCVVAFALRITHACVGAGTTWFGSALREHDGVGFNKLEAVWPFGGDAGLYALPDAERLTGFGGGDYISAFLVGVWVLLAIGLLWAFVASFYFTAATCIYFLLRRDVDTIDLGEVSTDEEAEAGGADSGGTAGPQPAPETAADTGTVSLPVVEEKPPESKEPKSDFTEEPKNDSTEEPKNDSSEEPKNDSSEEPKNDSSEERKNDSTDGGE